MSDSTAIEWTDATWSVTRGCSKVSAGCANCYAERMAARFSKPGKAFAGTIRDGHWNGQIKLVPEALAIPLRWRRPRRIFVDSMSDLFHDGVPDEYIAAVFGVMAATPRHTFQVLTKRPERALRWFETIGARRDVRDYCFQAAKALLKKNRNLKFVQALIESRADRWPLPNVWIGVSVEDQRAADERIPLLLQIPAAVRFLSCEPLIGITDIDQFLNGSERRRKWVIVGGESGPKARRCDRAWIQRIVNACVLANVPCFTKQLGAYVVDRNDAGWHGDEADAWPEGIEYVDDESHAQGWQGERVRVHLRNRKGSAMAEWPEALRVRQFPEVSRG